MDRSASGWGLALVVILTLSVRISVIALRWDDFAKDTDSYGALAVQLVQSGTYGFPVDPSPADNAGGSGLVRPTAYRPPLYPALLCLAAWPGAINPLGVAAIHVVLGLLTSLAVYYLAHRMNMAWPSIPALAVAFDPILLHQSTELMTEGLVTFLAVWAWALYLVLLRPTISELGQTVLGMRFWLRISLLLGLALGLACLTRPTMLPWSFLLIGTIGLRTSEAGNRVSMISAALLMLLVCNVGWMMRNKAEMGEPIVTTTHGGYTLLLANNPVVYRHHAKHGPDRQWNEDAFHYLWAQRREADPLNEKFWSAENEARALAEIQAGHPPKHTDIQELADDLLANKVALETINGNSELFAWSCLYRAGWFWAIYPNLTSDKGDNRKSQETVAESNQAGLGSDMVTGWLDLMRTQKVQIIQWAIGTWYTLWYVMAGLGLLRLLTVLSSRQWLVPLLLVLSLTAIHAIYFSNMRFRAPVMPVVYVFACWPLLRVRTLPRFAS